jgi:hypothetical protein
MFAPFDDAPAWASNLRSITADAALRDRLRIAGLGRALHFNWDESAERHVELFAGVARA